MTDITRLISFVSACFGRSINKSIDKLNRNVGKLSKLPDDELREKCREQKVLPRHNKGKSLLRIILDAIPFLPNTADELVIERLSLGVAAFKRCPADLSNTELYPSQIKAALALTQSCVLQMDTGEGKTYALLPAAYVLACQYGRVYILCANEYLAQRDAVRTKDYWDYVGLNVQYCSQVNNYKDNVWKGDVIYTTLDTLIFKGLNDDLARVPYELKLKFDAIIIDEIDAVLLDGNIPRSIVAYIDSGVFDWDRAIKYAGRLEEGVDITMDKDEMSASLSITGEARLKDYLNENSMPISLYGQMRKAIEISFVSLSVEEDRDYILQSGTIYSVNRYNGEIEFKRTHEWIIPLEIMKNIKPRPHSVALHTISPGVFLKQFKHISGMSGTVKEDAAEYLYAYGLPIAVVEPRIKRRKGELVDELYATQETAIRVLCGKIAAEINNKRPVLVGAQNIKEAKWLYNALIRKLNPAGVRLNLITSKDEKSVAEIYKNGGQVGSVIIATQIAGRGVDIRLSEEARSNGGLALFGFERAWDMRHDKQFLGRAGRQGDPYSAQFIVTYEGNLLKGTSGFAENILKSLEADGDDVPIQNKVLSNAITLSQKRIREMEFFNRRAMDFQAMTEEKIYYNIKSWFDNLNMDNGGKALPKSFIFYLIEHFINHSVKNSLKDNLNPDEAKHIVQTIGKILRLNDTDLFNPIALEGKRRELAVEVIKDRLHEKLTESFSSNSRLLKKKIALLNFVGKKHKYLYIKNMADGLIKSVSNGAGDYAVDKSFEELVNKRKYTDYLRIDDADDVKQIYILFNFLKKNMALLSEEKRIEAVELVENIADEPNWSRMTGRLKGRCKLLQSRSPELIAYWSIVGAGIRFREFKQKIHHSLAKQGLNSLQLNRILSDDLTTEWDKIESTLSANILVDLYSDPASLNELFFYPDNTVRWNNASNRENDYLAEEWNTIKKTSDQDTVPPVSDFNQKLISDFIIQFKPDMGPGLNFDLHHLEYLLQQFLENSPINTLQSPEKIITALENWKKIDTLTGVTEQRKKLNRKFILKFLAFLSEKKLISALPSFTHKARSLIGKVVSNIKDYKIIIPIASLLVWSAIFFLLSSYGAWYKPVDMSFTGFKLIDSFLCAGWMGKGIITAPVFMLYLLSNYPIQNNALMKYVYSIACASVLVFMSVEPYSFAGVLYAILRIIPISILYILFIGAISDIKKSMNLSLLSIWIIFCVLSAFLPELFRSGLIPVLIFSAVALYYCILHNRVNKEEILLASTQITGSFTNLESTLHKICRTIEGNVKCAPHIYALLFAFLVSVLLSCLPVKYQTYNTYLTILVYAAILFLVTNETLKARCSHRLWKKNLNSNSQMIIDKNAADEIIELETDEVLTGIRKKLFKREVILQSFAVLLCATALWGYKVGGSQFPLSLVVLPAAFIFGEQAVTALAQLSQLLIFRAQMVNETLDFKDIREPEEDKTLMEKISDFLNPFTQTRKTLNTILLIISVLYTLNAIYNKLLELFAR
jgi:preprotein translocase subunit SecA